MISCIPNPVRQLGQRLQQHLLTTDAFSYRSPLQLLKAYSDVRQSSPENQRAIRLNSLVVLQSAERFSVVLTSPADANPGKYRISILSPLGAALSGLQPGDSCTVNVMGIRSAFTVIQVIN
ncbi:GreA/GreB family elongation factor [Thalassolituus hydrocarboniclasticus]|uniref:GreA/GreB family elongation factor n=1 Tax=Thalassolituus hydrocarboniclasticus TaxID=2742796 RepID=A0ABY6A9T0_9GAMM|nr:GreA/GreB family elongation factor [Thalassolituus hydrocarboniclasticus]UXD86635.1 GreA/GreB family elongation factor [Thalassolituus hydrocarboniclasticus]